MRPRASRSIALIATLALTGALSSAVAEAQRRRPPPRRGSVVFVGGYFYDPFFGPYPWWTPGAYPWRYHPVFDDRADVRLRVEPNEAAVWGDDDDERQSVTRAVAVTARASCIEARDAWSLEAECSRMRRPRLSCRRDVEPEGRRPPRAAAHGGRVSITAGAS